MKENFIFEIITDYTNRSLGQTKFLLKLCDNNFYKLIEVEEKIKNTFYSVCPGDKEELESLLKTEDRTDYFKFNRARLETISLIKRLKSELSESKSEIDFLEKELEIEKRH